MVSLPDWAEPIGTFTKATCPVPGNNRHDDRLTRRDGPLIFNVVGARRLKDSNLVARKIVAISRNLSVPVLGTWPATVGHACRLILRGMHVSQLAAFPTRVSGGFGSTMKSFRWWSKVQSAADSADMLVRLAIEGVGIVRLGEIAVASAIHKGLLQPLLQEAHDPIGYPLWAVMPPGRQRTLAVKTFLDSWPSISDGHLGDQRPSIWIDPEMMFRSMIDLPCGPTKVT
jgi:LysR substrate binding domain